MSTIEEQKNWIDVVKENVSESIKHFDRAQKVHRILHRPDRTYEQPQVVVLYGPTGIGKSRRARQFFEEKKIDYYVKTSLTGKWWDGYNGEEGVIWDDFRGSNVKCSDLLILTDGYGTLVEVKGGTVWLKPKYWVFTSPKKYELWYDWTDENMAQMTRRVSSQFELKAEDPCSQ